VAKLIFEVFRVRLPGLPHQIDSIRDFGHESFGDAEPPVAVFIVRGDSHGVAASVGGVVVGAVVVDGPVGELEFSVGAHRIDIEEIRHAEFAEADFQTPTRQFFEE
jgi:hypothetical protein